MIRPTEEAKQYLKIAYSQTRRVISDENSPEYIKTFAFGLEHTINALECMAQAQKQTYDLLDRLNRSARGK